MDERNSHLMPNDGIPNNSELIDAPPLSDEECELEGQDEE